MLNGSKTILIEEVSGLRPARKSAGLAVKRLFDIIVSSVAMVLLAPIMLGIFIYIKLNSPGPVLFKQERAGFRGKPFILYKFRTMTNDMDESGVLLPADKRLKRWGLKLRQTDFDELPQLFNVLKGDMSLVGPRPLLISYIKLYTPEQFRRHEMRPGLTGLTQIRGRNLLTWEEKFKNDIKYIDSWSFWLDMRIIFITIIRLLCRADKGTQQFFTRFTGSQK